MQREKVIASVIGVIVVLGGVFVFRSDLERQFAPSRRPADSTTTVPAAPITNGSRSQVKSRVNYLISSQKELGDLWKLLETDAAMPTVDFETKSVIAVFAGEKQTAGYDIVVQSVVDSQAREVTISLIKPGPDCFVGQVITAPYQIAEVPKTALPYTHKDVEVIAMCE